MFGVIVRAFIVGLGLCLVPLLLGGCSQVTSATTQASTGATSAVTALRSFTVADLTAALQDAAAQPTTPGCPAGSGDCVATACYKVLIPLVQGAAAGGLLPTTPGAFSAFQKLRDAANVAQAGIPSYLNVACAPLVLDATNTVIGLAAKVGVALPAGALPIP